MFFERHIKKIFKNSLKNNKKNNGLKGAHMAPNSVVGHSYLSNWVYQFIECKALLTIFSYWYISCSRLNNSHALRKVEVLKGRGWLCFDIIFCVFTPSF
jgi:hypothetical protein